jgi:signal transduction histidine kinase
VWHGPCDPGLVSGGHVVNQRALSETPVPERALVLVVDDDATLRRMIVRALEADYRVAAAVDGDDGLAQAVALQPDLILSDIRMPGLTGHELLLAVRARPDLVDVPFLLLTAEADDSVRWRALTEGAQDYLDKPVSVIELRARVAIHVALKRARDMLQHELDSTSRDLEELAREVVARRHEAEAALRVRDEFVQEATHELRTPITNVLGIAQLLLRDLDRGGPADSAHLRRYVGIIEHQARRIGRLVNHLLELPHLEDRTLLPGRTDTDLTQLVHKIAASVQVTTDLHRLEVRAPDALVAAVDTHGIEEVVTDLLENAVKYSPEGGLIEVDLTSPEAAMARLEVRDHGVGVPPEKREHLFERFYQAHAGMHFAGQVGLGLGLYISRQIVEQHGGQITAEFPEDGGSRLVVRLPTSRPR